VERLAVVRAQGPATARVLIGGDAATAVDAVNRGGVTYLLSDPASHGAVEELLARCAPALSASATPRNAATGERKFPAILGESVAMQRLLELVACVARTDSTVLVLGETGTGKDLIGRAIHDASPRAKGPWCAVNSAAFPESLLESELFGHRRGSFTGATDNNKGLFEQADGGTLFLDEVAEMPLSMQAKLLRFLQTGEVRAVGSTATRVVDVRLVTATNKVLEHEIEKGAFREDLFYRLAVIPIEIPPLRSRMEDVPVLARHFARRVSARWGKAPVEIDGSAVDALMDYAWPGNVRELENVVERAVALCPGDVLRADALPRFGRTGRAAPTPRGEIPESLPTLERRHIIETLERVGWNRRRAAAVLQISTTTLWRRLKAFGIDGKPGRDAWLLGSMN
jgi:DNA-binding NtrC family response regulator